LSLVLGWPATCLAWAPAADCAPVSWKEVSASERGRKCGTKQPRGKPRGYLSDVESRFKPGRTATAGSLTDGDSNCSEQNASADVAVNGLPRFSPLAKAPQRHLDQTSDQEPAGRCSMLAAACDYNCVAAQGRGGRPWLAKRFTALPCGCPGTEPVASASDGTARLKPLAARELPGFSEFRTLSPIPASRLW